ncbi:DUF397 domain-containing protein [Streptomyces iconiensis]|uniref:DUF397 domain-containing protein n=1 Tax=Streptomyces iconiensis TaxID=1384038 RepID=A0ABT7AAD3_9ACTN|nr:DUF397 domain-containing protein [Streptomyces iconiensis]MDJ1138012.1 DUF397 domain-containing protein [Streptomyces iconiensis]
MLDLTWQKSSFSTNDPNGDCVELATGGHGVILLRESDLPCAVLCARPAVYARLLDRLKSGDPAFTLPGAAPQPRAPRP